MITFAYPQAAWLFLLPILVYYILPAVGKMYGDALQVPFVADIAAIKGSTASERRSGKSKSVNSFPKFLLLLVLWGLITAALCRPQWVGEPQKIHHESRDIMLIVDVSKSMLETDFVYQGRHYDRMSVVKKVVADFADARADDRVGLVVFGTRAYMQVPLTYDKASLKETLFAIEPGMAGDSTSIGDAIGVALKNLALSDGPAENKVIILLTDGESNDGSLSFPQAIKLAQEEKIKFYTIGVGSDSISFLGGLFSVPMANGLDETSLQQLAQATKGTYFRAKDVNALLQIYAEINRLEAQEHEGRYVRETKDMFYYPAAAALLLFLALFGLMRRK